METKRGCLGKRDRSQRLDDRSPELHLFIILINPGSFGAAAARDLQTLHTVNISIILSGGLFNHEACVCVSFVELARVSDDDMFAS